jgi:hypothetical protein
VTVAAAAVVDVSTLLKVIEASVVAGVGITILVSIAIWGSARASDYKRREQVSLAVVHVAVAVAALAGSVGGLIYGLQILTTK